MTGDDFPGVPPHGLGRDWPSREEALGATACRQVCRAQGDRAGDAEAAVAEAHYELTGRRGLSLPALAAARFPVRLTAAAVKVSTPAQLLWAFPKTPLADEWRRREEADLDWATSPTRGLVFHWTGWGVCVVHTCDWADPEVGARVAAPDGDGRLFLHSLQLLAQAAGWPPFS